MFKAFLQEIRKNQQNYERALKKRCEDKIKKLKLWVFKNSLKKTLLELNPIKANIESILQNTNTYKNSLVIKLTKSLIDEELKKNELCILNIARNLINNISENIDVEVIANDKDISVLEKYKEQIIRKIYFRKDNKIELGGMIIKANKSIIDAQILTQINQSLLILQEQKGISNGYIS